MHTFIKLIIYLLIANTATSSNGFEATNFSTELQIIEEDIDCLGKIEREYAVLLRDLNRLEEGINARDSIKLNKIRVVRLRVYERLLLTLINLKNTLPTKPSQLSFPSDFPMQLAEYLPVHNHRVHEKSSRTEEDKKAYSEFLKVEEAYYSYWNQKSEIERMESWISHAGILKFFVLMDFQDNKAIYLPLIETDFFDNHSKKLLRDFVTHGSETAAANR